MCVHVTLIIHSLSVFYRFLQSNYAQRQMRETDKQDNKAVEQPGIERVIIQTDRWTDGKQTEI